MVSAATCCLPHTKCRKLALVLFLPIGSYGRERTPNADSRSGQPQRRGNPGSLYSRHCQPLYPVINPQSVKRSRRLLLPLVLYSNPTLGKLELEAIKQTTPTLSDLLPSISGHVHACNFTAPSLLVPLHRLSIHASHDLLRPRPHFRTHVRHIRTVGIYHRI